MDGLAIANNLVTHFRGLFTSKYYEGCQLGLADIQVSTLWTEQLIFLSAKVMVTEVKQAVQDMHPTKAPRPGGFSAKFY